MSIRGDRRFGRPVAWGVPSAIGVDWITCTEKLASGEGRLLPEGRALLEGERLLGNEVRDWKWRDFRGRQCGGVSLGVRPGLSLVQLHSEFAAENWKGLAMRATNVSRIDLQITWTIEPADPKIFSRAKYNADRTNANASHPITVSLITSQQTGDTLYLGRRASPVFGRFYDTGMERGEFEPGALTRQELELKKDCALATAQLLLSEVNEAAAIFSMVDQYFTSKGITVRDRIARDPGSYPLIARAGNIGESHDKFRWLNAVVRPILERLEASGHLTRAIDAMGLADKVIILNSDDNTDRTIK